MISDDFSFKMMKPFSKMMNFVQQGHREVMAHLMAKGADAGLKAPQKYCRKNGRFAKILQKKRPFCKNIAEKTAVLQ